jgi:DHHC palmitoyltransferase
MRHRPIKKVKRTSLVFTVAVLLNIGVCYVFYFKMNKAPTMLLHLHYGLKWSSMACFVVALPTFLLAALLQPGYIKPKFNFVQLVDKLLDEGLHLDNLCVYDEVLKSETSFHCTICDRCVDQFDHHCPFINNCIGARNHSLFLVFIFSYVCFVILVLTDTLRNLIDLCQQDRQTNSYYTFAPTLTVLIFILLLLPVVLFQSY